MKRNAGLMYFLKISLIGAQTAKIDNFIGSIQPIETVKRLEGGKLREQVYEKMFSFTFSVNRNDNIVQLDAALYI